MKQLLLVVISLITFSSNALANTNYRADSFDIYSANIGGDSHDDLVFIPKDKIVLIASDVAVPIVYQDGDAFALIYSNGGYSTVTSISNFDTANKTKISDYSIETADLNNDGLNDLVLAPNAGAVTTVYGSKTGAPSSVRSGESYAGVINDASTSYNTVSTSSGDAVVVSRNGATMLVDEAGAPYNITQPIKAGNAVGYIKGEFTVSAGGASVYRLPIDLVSGPGGIKPSVSVNYYSQGGYGLLGKGWSLSAAEAISRCKPSGRATDAPDYDAADSFCLNGDELVKFVANGANVYRKKSDDGTIVQKNSAGVFTAYLEDGTTKTFNQVLLKNDSSIVKAWYLGSVTSKGGASYHLNYSMDQKNGEALLSKIAYGSHSVSFAYEERPDRRFGYDHGGAKFASTKRLSSIATYGNKQSIANYTFHYGYNKRVDQSYLTHIQKCVGSSCYGALAFDWQMPTESATAMYGGTVDRAISFKYDEYIALGDVDGNGTTDIIGYGERSNQKDRIRVFKSALSSNIAGAGEVRMSHWVNGDDSGSSLMAGDVDNDGIDDIVFSDGDETRAYPSGGALGFKPGDTGDQNTPNGQNHTMIDVNGDGVLDLVFYKNNKSTKTVHVYTGQGNGKFGNLNSIIVHGKKTNIKYAFGDVNGDGKTDLILNRSGAKSVEIRFGGGTTARATFANATSSSLAASVSKIATTDINGDGLADLAVLTAKTLRIYPSNGSTFSSESYQKTFDAPDDKPTLRFLDINGDGRSDFVENGNYYLGRIDSSLSEAVLGTGVIKYIDEYTTTSESGTSITTLVHSNNLTLVDINGDGARDLVKYRNGSKHLSIQKGTSTDLSITSFIDSNKQSTVVSYKQMTDPSVYTRAQPKWFKSGIGMSLNPSLSLVAQTTTPEGDTYFKYGGAQTSLDDGYLGFQLFSSVSDRDSYDKDKNKTVKSIVSTTYMEQSPLLVGKQYQVYKRVFNAPSKEVSGFLQYIDSDGVLSAKLDYSTNSKPRPSWWPNNLTALHSGTVNPLLGISRPTTVVPQLKSASNISVGAQSSSVHLENWFAMDLGSGSYRPVLKHSEMTYKDPDEFSDDITRKTTDITYEMTSIGKIVRPSSVTVTEGLASSDYLSTKKTVIEAYQSNGSNNPAQMAAALLPTQQLVTISASGGWLTQLSNAGLASSQSHRENMRYNSKNQVESAWVTERSADELKTVFKYDATGNVKQTSISKMDGSNARHSYYVFDQNTGVKLSGANAQGHITTYSGYDKYGNPGLVSVSNGQHGQRLDTRYQYDNFGRVIKETRSTGEVVSTAYNKCTTSLAGCVAHSGVNESLDIYIKVSSSQGGESYKYFNKLGLPVKTATAILGGYSVSATEYDRHQRKRFTTTPVKVANLSNASLGTKQYSYYDVLDKLVLTEDGVGGASSFEWDYKGRGLNVRTVGVKVDSGFTRNTVETYNALSQLIKVVQPNGSVTKYLYDVNGNIVRQWYSKASYTAANPESNTAADAMHVIAKQYDKLGRLIQETDPDRGTTQYQYTAFGELKEQSSPRVVAGDVSQAQRYVYDKLGRLTQQTNADGTSCYYYDEAQAGYSIGQLTESRYYKGSVATCGAGQKPEGYYAQQTYRFNAKGLLTSQDQFIQGATSAFNEYTYTISGQLLSKKWYGDNSPVLTTNYGYNAQAGVLASISDGAKTHWQLTDMDAIGNATGVTLGGAIKVVKNYKAETGTLTNVRAATGLNSTNTLLNLQYRYNNNGFVTQLTDAANSMNNWHAYQETYHYDDAAHRQLTAVDVVDGTLNLPSAFKYKYDALGNIRYASTVGQYSYNSASAPHRVTAVGGNAYVYNAEGSVTSDGSRTLNYGHNHLPTRMVKGNDASEYVYSASNALLYRKDMTDGATVQENWYFGDMQYTKKGSAIERVYSIAEGVTIVIDDGANSINEAQYSITNNIGSTVLTLKLTPDNNVIIKQRLRYDAFGKSHIIYDGATPTSIQDWSGYTTKDGFTGHEHMYELDLIHMQGRVYDPIIGRFLQADVVVQEPKQILSYNRYAYVWNNPGAFTDPSGYFIQDAYDGTKTKSWDSWDSYPSKNNANSDKDSNSGAEDSNKKESKIKRAFYAFTHPLQTFAPKWDIPKVRIYLGSNGIDYRRTTQSVNNHVWASGYNAMLVAGDTGIQYLEGEIAGLAIEGAAIAAIGSGVLRLGGGVTKSGYHATHPEAAEAILQGGFRQGTKPGRLGSGGTYVNNTPEGAIAEFAHHNPGVTPKVLKVDYNPGANASASVAPRNYVEQLPLNVDSISAPSVRAPGTINTNAINGSARATEILP